MEYNLGFLGNNWIKLSRILPPPSKKTSKIKGIKNQHIGEYPKYGIK
jgi:hypothetical protein